MYNIIIVIIAILIPIIILRKEIKKESNIKKFIKQNWQTILIYIIFVVAFLARLLGIEYFPGGLNQDEASAGYEAFSIFNYGIDRKGESFPVHFISWGSGQNALYSYIMIPFIAILGLNVFAVRLPMAIAGCISVIVIYKLLKRYNKKLLIIGLAFFAICPWHIMKSRWGLESNLFPDIVLWAVYYIINSFENKKISTFYIGMAILSISVYSYGTSYLFLPIFIVILLIYLLKTKRISFKQALISLSISFVIALPMIIFVIINTFDLPEVKIGAISIPRLYENRYESVTNIFSQNFFSTVLTNFRDNITVLLKQHDGLNYNAIPFFGITYTFSVCFTIIGLFECIRHRTLEKNILNFGFITSMILLCVLSNANINRMNICMLPLIMYTIVGINTITKRFGHRIIIPISIIYMISFMCFASSYIKTQNTIFQKGIEEPLKYVSKLDVEHIYIKSTYYIYTLFYLQTPVHEFIDTAKYEIEKIAFENVKSYGKYEFYLPAYLSNDNAAYLVDSNFKYDTNKFKETKFGNYMVLEPK